MARMFPDVDPAQLEHRPEATVYAALRLSTGAWLFVKGVISYGMLGLQVAGEILYIRYILRPRWQSRDETESAPPHPEPRAR